MKFKSIGKSKLLVEMYDPLGHFVYFDSHGGFRDESGHYVKFSLFPDYC